MALAEKIAALRGERKLSQGDLAELLDVSRQSVSKWETGQSVPELDKIVKLADLFGVTVDDLVREGEASPRPGAAPAGEPAPRVVYVGWRFTAPQTVGIILLAGGLLMMLCGVLFHASDPLFFIGAALAVAGLPLLLVKRHPLLAEGWVVWTVACLLLCTPPLMGEFRTPLFGFWLAWKLVSTPHGYGSGAVVVWLFYLAWFGLAVLTIVLPVLTGRLCWTKWKAYRRERRKDDDPVPDA